MAAAGAELLNRNAERVNALNVFPVPDGDTGTNMNLTMTSGMKELQGKTSPHLGKVVEALSKGLLMGARGNSGVILSQLFRGFAKSLAASEEAGPAQLAAALQYGVDMAYKAVVKPVEGTILTVAREAAKHAVTISRRTNTADELMREVYEKANEALQRTPEQLPVLKQVGVVDSGGQGLVYIYEGFARVLSTLDAPQHEASEASFVTEAALPEDVGMADRLRSTAAGRPAMGHSAQSRLATEDIEFLYDMEFFIDRNKAAKSAPVFNEQRFKDALAKDGDSILVIESDDVIKVHVHSRKPGDVLNLALPYGELIDIHILNMREQHRDLLGEEGHAESDILPDREALAAAEVLTGGAAPQTTSPEQVHEYAPFGIIAVAMGEGIAEILLDNNVDIVLSGGQTMNPSTEDFVKAIEALPAEHIFLLPNNGNIILAAEQAAELVGRSVSVITTRTVPQGLAAALAFREDESIERNSELMKRASESVRSGQVTQAVRDTSIDGIAIREGDFIGIQEKAIVVSTSDLNDACRTLLSGMLEEGGDLITVLTGEDADASVTSELKQWLNSEHPDVEVEVLEGGQPLYPYVFAVE
ncbi:DAK2 domain-containing protein [Paenibacillus sp. PR3]|uniref:DAK2 domain-containing protein n=1 Tax=Paenibacillus terricola TaxID=2763503 RepID=A0ABR8MT79_9BACL|nr:DAK2 domain-containing protein [Paenibacillus terricola]MBD3918157.1 DAK2 domain-containing protein [Paenibacillus terricola]